MWLVNARVFSASNSELPGLRRNSSHRACVAFVQPRIGRRGATFGVAEDHPYRLMIPELHALQPELFHFQHATYVDSLVLAINTFIRPMSDRDHERLYEDCCVWYLRYGISARHMPETWAEFVDYFADACATRLRVSKAGTELMPEVLRPDAWTPRMLPNFAVRELLHERTRELFDIKPHAVDRVAFHAYAATVRAGTAISPRWIRYLPQVRNAPTDAMVA